MKKNVIITTDFGEQIEVVALIFIITNWLTDILAFCVKRFFYFRLRKVFNDNF